ncbi:marR family transcriptional regulator [Planomonospora sphaerica]|uniref:MarR family transcriptional regulator n=1 Tax=Planomonospora sphaerica TaxID=161355 RepID=A0A171CHQ9_9ACTN|nr:MarR family transcriptional regulator [Planomonospora sphaerica]GAT66719.1 marR family transcriptional regulator [Planomonospora sphaerica]
MAEPDSIDRHIAHWSRELPDLDPRTEGIITRLQMLVRRMKRDKESGLLGTGLKYWEFEVLHRLVAAGAPYRVAPTALAEWLDTHPATMTSRLDRLEQAGYIAREHDPGDRRRLLVTLTGLGRERWEAVMDRRGETEDRMLAVLDDGEQEALAALLRKLVAGIEADGPPLMPDWPAAR